MRTMNEMSVDAIESVGIELGVDRTMTCALWQRNMVWTICTKHTMAMTRSHLLRFRIP
jgi:hypothetical protein